MERVRWVMNRIAAALVGAALVGCLAAAIVSISAALTCGPRCMTLESDSTGTHCLKYAESTCGSGMWSTAAFFFVFTPIVAIALGTLPGIIALTMTPARRHPWRSLPILALGTLFGFAMWWFLGEKVFWYDWGPIELLVAIPTLTGLATTFTIDRFPPRRNTRIESPGL